MRAPGAHGQPARRVPEVTAYFWILKVLTTGMGETTSDYLVRVIDPVVAVGLAAIVLIISLAVQFASPRYSAWPYWFVVAMVSIVGTMAADALHVVVGIPYVVSTAFYAVVLAVVFVAWYAREKTLSIHGIFTRRREAFYWAVVFATFALGTAAGDLTATTLGWGYLASGLLFAAVIAIPAIGYWKFHWNEVFAFWFAYIVTRPLGASFADWMGKPRNWSGLSLGDGPVSLGWAAAIVVFVTYLAYSQRDARE
ncbi:MAG TPA: hypothetical protein VME66_05510 [Candidatus Acidoferrales bacterium]|nr:hypothetical protein [Candidatus Acidoferrales bacterium]